jgi:hypothetical protein
MKSDELGAFIVSAPLYKLVTIDDPTTRYGGGDPEPAVRVPRMVDADCLSCGPTKWAQDTDDLAHGYHYLTYTCRNCAAQDLLVVLSVRVEEEFEQEPIVTVQKCGQLPKLEVSVPKPFEKALGERASLYRKGMTLRHNNYGIGAMTYLRRLIEETTDEMLDLLEAALTESEATEALATLKRTRDGIRFEDKVKLAARVLPDHLRPGGVNPFGDLYEVLSIGLHGLSDEDCCDIVDSMDESLKFIYTRLKTEADENKAYREAAKGLSAKLSALKAKKKKEKE